MYTSPVALSGFPSFLFYPLFFLISIYCHLVSGDPFHAT